MFTRKLDILVIVFQKCFRNLIIVGFWILIPQVVLAHAGHRGFVMLLPTDLFMMGGGVVVVFTFVSMVFVTRETDIEKFSIPKIHNDEISPKLWVSSLTLFTLVLLVWIGFTGNRDPMKNLLPMTFWVFFWIGMTVVSAIFGNIWSFVSPWTVIERIIAKLKKLYIVREISLDYSRSFSYLPALILFAGFAWFELIHPSPMDPDVLAKFVLLYIFVTILGIIFFGGNKWIEKGEAFTVYFRMVGWLSPIHFKEIIEKNEVVRKHIALRWPCAGLLRIDSLSKSGVAFVILVLSTVSFDGLSRTFWWLSMVGVNPLEYPGRTSMVLINTVGLFSTFLVFSGAYYFTQRLTFFINSEISKNSSFIFSMIPIAFGYHFAHYLPTFLVDVQYAIISISDPFDIGWDLLGTSDWVVTSSYLTNYDSVVFIWSFQVLGIVLAHIGAVIVSHYLQLEASKSQKHSIIGQIPSTLLMVAYTVFGLWLLSTPVYG